MPLKLPWINLKSPWNPLKTSLKHPENFRETFMKDLEHPLNFFLTTLKHHKNFLGIPMKLFWNTLEIPLKLPWKFPLKFFQMPMKLTENSLDLSWNTLETFVKYPWNFLKHYSKLKLLEKIHEISLKHHLNFRDKLFKLISNILETPWILHEMHLPPTWNTHETLIKHP